MKEIVVIAPIDNIYNLARDIVADRRYNNVEVLKGNLSKGAKRAHAAIAQGAKIIVSRGGTYHMIRQSSSIPVVEIKVDAYDIVEGYEKVSDEAEEIAVVGYDNVIYGFDFLKKIIRQRITMIEIKQESDIHDVIMNHKQSGIHTYIGDSNVMPIIEQLGCNGILIQSRRETIHNSIQEARRILYATKEEKKRTQQLVTMTDFIHDGVISIDENEVVTLFNKRASEIFSLPKDQAVGRRISEVIPFTRLPEVLRDKHPQLSKLQEVGGSSITTNRVPILVEGEIKGAVATFQEVTEVQKLEQKIRLELSEKGFVAKYRFKDIVYCSRMIENCIETAKKYARYDTPVHICGSSGVGKELFCQSIHNASPRSKGPFVAINCAAISPTLIESELFGYAEGSFTGANRKGKPGIFELAHKGTLFLDEISELPLDLQGRLLRVLQEKQVMRVGGGKMIPIDVRVITASNQYLRKLVQDGKFRKDLFFRINILTLRIPDLGRRREDIPVLARWFMEKYSELYDKPPLEITEPIRQLLSTHDYQGNVRELEGMIEKSVILSSFDELRGTVSERVQPGSPTPGPAQTSASAPRPRNIQDMEKTMILEAVEAAGGNMQIAAYSLGISRTTLWRKLKKMSV